MTVLFWPPHQCFEVEDYIDGSNRKVKVIHAEHYVFGRKVCERTKLIDAKTREPWTGPTSPPPPKPTR